MYKGAWIDFVTLVLFCTRSYSRNDYRTEESFSGRIYWGWMCLKYIPRSTSSLCSHLLEPIRLPFLLEPCVHRLAVPLSQDLSLKALPRILCPQTGEETKKRKEHPKSVQNIISSRTCTLFSLNDVCWWRGSTQKNVYFLYILAHSEDLLMFRMISAWAILF